MSGKDTMRIGKITQTAWQRSVRKQLHTGKENMLFAASPWETCSGFRTETGDGCVWADAHAAGDDVRTGYYAVYHAENNHERLTDGVALGVEDERSCADEGRAQR